MGNIIIEPVPNLPNLLPRRESGPIAAFAVNHFQNPARRSLLVSLIFKRRITTS